MSLCTRRNNNRWIQTQHFIKGVFRSVVYLKRSVFKEERSLELNLFTVQTNVQRVYKTFFDGHDLPDSFSDMIVKFMHGVIVQFFDYLFFLHGLKLQLCVIRRRNKHITQDR